MLLQTFAVELVATGKYEKRFQQQINITNRT